MSEEAKPAKKGGKGKLLLLALPLVLAAAGAGLWFSGILPDLLGMGAPAAADAAHGDGHAAAPAAGHGGTPAPPAAAAPRAPVFFDMPDIVANLSVTGRRASYVKLRSKLELSKAEDAAAIQAAMPRLQDLFTTYLREMRPEELRGSSGTQRLREELMARANLAVAPVRVTDVLFIELLLQ
ncbi:flagellar basal body-associated FliL family protein [Paeniroseomonas aquatica]|uniref:Flagellar protein FliL n=1 Tax=Paeniroseomonas aquatica TaxID=373043 RepID=A0ABT8AC70_9PROT|nr:flagellar basal body-associated FliL family protein [Paeniroseomonas aquatica]MDN3567351.1 flagellar basal body-associated FliL family protein [Paeniroseomonas aquatica]